MELRDINGKIAELERKKSEMIGKLHKVNDILRNKKMVAMAYAPYLEGKDEMRAGPLRKKAEELEFRISTEAFDRHKEAEMIKELKETEKKLKKAIEVEKRRKGKMYAEANAAGLEKERSELEGQLIPLRLELRRLYALARKGKEKRERKESERREHAPYMKKLEVLSLEDVVEIERK